MQHEIRKYQVQNPLLKNYIRFFWEVRIDHMQLNHKLIPQRNINLRFNLSETPQYVCLDGSEYLTEDVFFAGIQDHNINANMKLNGKVHLLGVCFLPNGFYPFFQIPVSEFQNQVLGAREANLKFESSICEQLKGAPNIAARLDILEKELLILLIKTNPSPDKFSELFKALKDKISSQNISQFCKMHNIGTRNLERMFNKYVGVSAITFSKLNRFHTSLNQLIINDYSKLSDIAYENYYFDQTHFIKDFKRFAGNSPKNFVNQNNSILQIGKLQ